MLALQDAAFAFEPCAADGLLKIAGDTPSGACGGSDHGEGNGTHNRAGYRAVSLMVTRRGRAETPDSKDTDIPATPGW